MLLFSLLCVSLYLNINQQQCYRVLQQLAVEDKQKQSQYYKVQCGLQTLYKTMTFVLEINLRCNPLQRHEISVWGYTSMVPFEIDFSYCVLGFKRQFTCVPDSVGRVSLTQVWCALNFLWWDMWMVVLGVLYTWTHEILVQVVIWSQRYCVTLVKSNLVKGRQFSAFLFRWQTSQGRDCAFLCFAIRV